MADPYVRNAADWAPDGIAGNHRAIIGRGARPARISPRLGAGLRSRAEAGWARLPRRSRASFPLGNLRSSTPRRWVERTVIATCDIALPVIMVSVVVRLGR